MLHDADTREMARLARHLEQAERHRQLAEELGLAGYRDQAATHALEARLHDLEAAALAAVAEATAA